MQLLGADHPMVGAADPGYVAQAGLHVILLVGAGHALEDRRGDPVLISKHGVCLPSIHLLFILPSSLVHRGRVKEQHCAVTTELRLSDLGWNPAAIQKGTRMETKDREPQEEQTPVSYTHLTLPTILRV